MTQPNGPAPYAITVCQIDGHFLYRVSGPDGHIETSDWPTIARTTAAQLNAAYARGYAAALKDHTPQSTSVKTD